MNEASNEKTVSDATREEKHGPVHELLARVSGVPPERWTTIEIYRMEGGQLGAVVLQRLEQDQEQSTICDEMICDRPLRLFGELTGWRNHDPLSGLAVEALEAAGLIKVVAP